MSDWLGLEGRRVVIAGAGGIGAAAAQGFVDAGARLALLDVSAERLAEAAATLDLAEHGGDVHQVDLTDADACRAAVEAARGALGGIDVLVHAVGVNHRVGIEEYTDADWHRIIAINLSSAFWLGQAVGPIMRDQGRGRIVFLSSVAGLLGHAHHGPYAASKGGVNQLMKVMAREWAPHGVTVNAVAPGYVETDLTRAHLDSDGHRAELTALVPAGRLGTPGEVVGPLLFLASDHAGFVTGHVLYVDGGRTLV